MCCPAWRARVRQVKCFSISRRRSRVSPFRDEGKGGARARGYRTRRATCRREKIARLLSINSRTRPAARERSGPSSCRGSAVNDVFSGASATKSCAAAEPRRMAKRIWPARWDSFSFCRPLPSLRRGFIEQKRRIDFSGDGRGRGIISCFLSIIKLASVSTEINSVG